MTAEEAVKQLQGMIVGAEWLSDYQIEALKMAIDLLFRYDDLISRTELIRKLKHLEQFNNKDVPDWVWSAIGGTKGCQNHI